MLRLPVLALALAVSMPVAADPVPRPGDADYETRLICRKDTPTGSHIRSRTECRTQAQWDALARGSQNMAGDLVERHRGTPSCNGGGC